VIEADENLRSKDRKYLLEYRQPNKMSNNLINQKGNTIAKDKFYTQFTNRRDLIAFSNFQSLVICIKASN